MFGKGKFLFMTSISTDHRIALWSCSALNEAKTSDNEEEVMKALRVIKS